jgi:hypothetical protein
MLGNKGVKILRDMRELKAPLPIIKCGFLGHCKRNHKKRSIIKV